MIFIVWSLHSVILTLTNSTSDQRVRQPLK